MFGDPVEAFPFAALHERRRRLDVRCQLSHLIVSGFPNRRPACWLFGLPMVASGGPIGTLGWPRKNGLLTDHDAGCQTGNQLDLSS